MSTPLSRNAKEYIPTYLREKRMAVIIPPLCKKYISSSSEIHDVRYDERLLNFIKDKNDFILIDGYNDYYVQTKNTGKVPPIVILTYYRLLFSQIAKKHPTYNFIIVTKYPYGVDEMKGSNILLNKNSDQLPENMIILLSTKDVITEPMTNNGHEDKEYDDRLLLYIAYKLLISNKQFNTVSRDLYGSFHAACCTELIAKLNKKSLQNLGIKNSHK